MRTTETMRSSSLRPAVDRYDSWTVEELRAFAAQLQLRDAHTLTRCELLAIFAPREQTAQDLERAAAS